MRENSEQINYKYLYNKLNKGEMKKKVRWKSGLKAGNWTNDYLKVELIISVKSNFHILFCSQLFYHSSTEIAS